MFLSTLLPIISLALISASTQYSATYTPDNAPDKTQDGQSGTNKCGTANSQDSVCQNMYLNGVDDFCLYAPPGPGAGEIGSTERIEVAWCLKSGYGTRLIPDGTIQGAHFVQTPNYVQITGTGDLTKLNIQKGDSGGELDPHGADGNGNPIGGLVFGHWKNGTLIQYHELTNFMSETEFCFRACVDAPEAPAYCQHIYDVMGCHWNMPGNYDAGFTSCDADSVEPMGVYGASTFHQGDGQTPDPHPAAPTSNCATLSTIANHAVVTGAVTSATSATASATGSGKNNAPPAATGSAGSQAASAKNAAIGRSSGVLAPEAVWAIAGTLATALVSAGTLAL